MFTRIKPEFIVQHVNITELDVINEKSGLSTIKGILKKRKSYFVYTVSRE